MVDKICSHCGATILVGLKYCPGCLKGVSHRGNGANSAVAVAPDARGTWLERVGTKWHAIVDWFSPSANLYDLTYKPEALTSMSEAYTRVVCPKCLRPHRAPLNQSPSARVICHGCFLQFPASMAAEFRKGADLNCLHCGTSTFCTNGLRVNQCPNCQTRVERARDPEKVKLLALASFVLASILIGFIHAAATQTMGQFLVWLCIATVFTAVGFVVMVALGM